MTEKADSAYEKLNFQFSGGPPVKLLDVRRLAFRKLSSHSGQGGGTGNACSSLSSGLDFFHQWYLCNHASSKLSAQNNESWTSAGLNQTGRGPRFDVLGQHSLNTSRVIQKSNSKLVTSRPESDSLVTQVGIWAVGRGGGEGWARIQ